MFPCIPAQALLSTIVYIYHCIWQCSVYCLFCPSGGPGVADCTAEGAGWRGVWWENEGLHLEHTQVWQGKVHCERTLALSFELWTMVICGILTVSNVPLSRCATGGAWLWPCCAEENRPTLHLPAGVCPKTPAQWPPVQDGGPAIQDCSQRAAGAGQGQEPMA